MESFDCDSFGFLDGLGDLVMLCRIRGLGGRSGG